jgi:uncharacterized membrane protein
MNLEPETRLWIYRIIGAIVPILVTAGTLTEGLASQIMNLVAAILALGGSALAAHNVPK